MKLKTQRLRLDALLEECRALQQSGEHYVIISTKEMLEDLQLVLDTFCKNLKSNDFRCWEEFVPSSFQHGFVLISLKKLAVTKSELEKCFMSLPEDDSEIITGVNSLDYNNNSELDWFKKKLSGFTYVKADVETEKIGEGDYGPQGIGTTIHDPYGTGSTMEKFENVEFFRPSSARYFNEGVLYDIDYRFEDADDCFKMAVELDNDNYIAWYHRGHLLYKRGSFSSARNFLLESLRINPNYSTARRLLGNCEFMEGKYHDALENFRHLLKHDSKHEKIGDDHINIGKTFVMMGDIDQAVVHFQEARKILDTTSEMTGPLWALYLWWVQGLFHEKDFAGMIDILKIIVAKEPRDYRSWINMGYCYDQIGRRADGLNCYQIALDAEPENPETIFNMAHSLEWSREYARALPLWKKAYEKYSDKPETLPSIKKHIEFTQDMVDKEDGRQTEKIPEDDLKAEIRKQVDERMRDMLSGVMPAMPPLRMKPGMQYGNERKLLSVYKACTEYIYLVDRYYNKTGLDMLSEALEETGNKISRIKILTAAPDNKDKLVAIQKLESLKNDFKKFRGDCVTLGIELAELRIMDDKWVKKIHDRYLETRGACYNMISPNTVQGGQIADITSTVPLKEFPTMWEESHDIFNDWNKILEFFS